MKKALFTMVAAAMLAQSVFAADVTGKWVAETEGRNGEKRTMTFDLKSDGSKLTGKVSSRMGEREITEGKVSGDDVSFVVVYDANGETRKVPYTGKLSGNELKLKMGSGERSREVTAKRATS